MKPTLIVNPKSGGGNTVRTFDAIKTTIERALGACDVAMTEHAGHGIDLARDAANRGAELVIAVGGDGTVHTTLSVDYLTTDPAAANSIFANGGTSIMIHEKADDMKTDPTGNAGNRIACGVITPPAQ